MKELSGNDGKYKVASACCYADTDFNWLIDHVVWVCTQCGLNCKALIVEKNSERKPNL